MLPLHCKLCWKNYRRISFIEHYDLEIRRRKKYRFEKRDKIEKCCCDNREKTKEYVENKKQSDLNFKLACNLRSRISLAFESQNVKKTNKTFDLLGCFHSFLKNWNIHQVYGEMTLEKNDSMWQNHHCLPMASFNLLDENDMKKCFNWINLRSMYSIGKNLKKGKIDPNLFLLQESKATQFLKLNEEEGFNENIHWWNI